MAEPTALLSDARPSHSKRLQVFSQIRTFVPLNRDFVWSASKKSCCLWHWTLWSPIRSSWFPDSAEILRDLLSFCYLSPSWCCSLCPSHTCSAPKHSKSGYPKVFLTLSIDGGFYLRTRCRYLVDFSFWTSFYASTLLFCRWLLLWRCSCSTGCWTMFPTPTQRSTRSLLPTKTHSPNPNMSILRHKNGGMTLRPGPKEQPSLEFPWIFRWLPKIIYYCITTRLL